MGSLVRMRDGSINSWVRGVISPSHGGDEDGDQFVGSWRDLAGGRGGMIGSWVRGVISSSHSTICFDLSLFVT